MLIDFVKTQSSSQELDCHACGIDSQATKVVVSRGNPLSRLMIVGEAPGALEEEVGLPFVGRSGKVLDKLLEEIGLNPAKDVYICNAVKCRPPKNRRPSKTELRVAAPWLEQQIKLVDPWIIVLAGSTAVEAVLGDKKPISSLRGIWLDWNKRCVLPIFHPSYLLRNPSRIKGKPFSLTLEDLLQVRNKLYEFQKVLCHP